MKVLITSGGTKVPIDDVRHIGNMSSGKYGAEIAARFLEQRDSVIFFSEKGSKHPYNFLNINEDFGISDAESYFLPIQFKTYDDYLGVVNVSCREQPDIIISAAAVSDYMVDKTDGKISSSDDEVIIRLKKAKKILPELRKAAPNAILVGFKLLVSPSYQEVQKAVQKVLNSGADYVVYNDLTRIRNGDQTRLVFNKYMKFAEVASAKELVEYIIKKYEKSENQIPF